MDNRKARLKVKFCLTSGVLIFVTIGRNAPLRGVLLFPFLSTIYTDFALPILPRLRYAN